MLSITLPAIRGTDTNSLHRFQDKILPFLDSPDRAERGKAQLLIRRIGTELKKRTAARESGEICVVLKGDFHEPQRRGEAALLVL